MKTSDAIWIYDTKETPHMLPTRDDQFRLECLRFAISGNETVHPESVVSRAKQYADFVLNTDDGKIVAAARKFLDEAKNA